MPFVTLKDVELTNNAYDFIVVGAGSAGCPLASRLSEDLGVTVLLVEAGPRYHSFEDALNQTIPAAAGKVQHVKSMDWGYYTQPQAPRCCLQLNTFEGAPDKKYCSYWPRGKGLGGSSQINYMAWVRGFPNDYNEWDTKHGCGNGWNWSSMKSLFDDRIENISACNATLLSSKRRSIHTAGSGGKGNGPYGISHKNPICSLANQFVEACQELGFEKDDYNDCQKVHKGVVGLHQHSVRKGTRCTASRAYIEPLMMDDNRRPNLTVLTGAKCTRILTTKNKDGKIVATGVELYPDDDEDCTSSTTRLEIKCSKEVILSAGALGSPQILLQSGIGPKGSTLDSPQVGQNLLDHLFVMIRFPPKLGQGKQDIGSVTPDKAEGWKTGLLNLWDCFINHKGILTTPAYDASLFFSNKPVAGGLAGLMKVRPNLQISCMCSPLDSPFIHGNVGMDTDSFELDPIEFSPTAEGLVFTCILLHPESKGTVTINDETNELLIDANYLGDQNSEDLKHLVDCVKKALQIANTKPYQPVIRGAPFWPKDLCRKYNLPCHDEEKVPAVEDYPDEFLVEYIRRYSTTLYHPTTTCRMGTNATDSVVDPNLKVFGVDKLRVADASIQPYIVSGNTQASCVVIGEKAADILQKEYNLKTNLQDLLDAVDTYEANLQKKRRMVAGGLLATVAAVVVGISVVATRSGLRSM